jgi:glucose-6-phosphate isomerase
MNFTKNIDFKNFKKKIDQKKINKNLKNLIKNKNEIINSLTPQYRYSYSKNFVKNIIKKNNSFDLRVIGMGGSILGLKAIYNFLSLKIKKKIYFFDNLNSKLKKIKNSKKNLNLIISKSGNTLETISNVNVLLKKNDKNIFITNNNNNYLRDLAIKLKADVIDHNNFIGGRYSVLSEVGMLPASLIGLSEKKFKQFNNIVKNKKFINSLISNVANIIFFLKKKKYNSVILNYDENSEDLFKWYQQLVAESLGKKQKGIFPIISTMPKDNHSLMQLFLDGPKNNFFTFFNVNEKKSEKIVNSNLFKSYSFLKNKDLNFILNSQKLASEKVFTKKNIPFRSFDVLKRNEETLGELFSFFILETILISKSLNINPYNQPLVELIKTETKKNLIF